jgi:hypothetical protein
VAHRESWTYTIYDRPDDFPDKVVVRRHDISRGPEPIPDPQVFRFDSIEDARLFLWFCNWKMPRFPEDKRSIVEVWFYYPELGQTGPPWLTGEGGLMREGMTAATRSAVLRDQQMMASGWFANWIRKPSLKDMRDRLVAAYQRIGDDDDKKAGVTYTEFMKRYHAIYAESIDDAEMVGFLVHAMLRCLDWRLIVWTIEAMHSQMEQHDGNGR